MLDVAHRYFLEVVRTGSVKEAAENLHIVASAVSRQVAKLEESCGTALFERRPHGMVPTQAGELLTKYARRAAMDAQRLRQELRNLGNAQPRITIRIGSNEAVALSLLPSVLGAFRTSQPDVAFHVQIASPAGIGERLADGSIDVGLTFNVRPGSDVVVRHEVDAPLRAIMAPTHPLVGRDLVSLNDLKPYPIALTDSGTTVRLLFDSYLSAGDGPSFDIAYSSGSSSVIYAIVKTTHAITLAGEVTLRESLDRRELAAIPISESRFDMRTLQVQTAKDRLLTAEAESFVSSLIRSLPNKAHG